MDDKKSNKKFTLHKNTEILWQIFILIKENKKWWLLPLFFILMVLSLFVSLSGNQSILPAIYALF